VPNNGGPARRCATLQGCRMLLYYCLACTIVTCWQISEAWPLTAVAKHSHGVLYITSCQISEAWPLTAVAKYWHGVSRVRRVHQNMTRKVSLWLQCHGERFILRPNFSNTAFSLQWQGAAFQAMYEKCLWPLHATSTMNVVLTCCSTCNVGAHHLQVRWSLLYRG
jgi:hypothetical protein